VTINVKHIRQGMEGPERSFRELGKKEVLKGRREKLTPITVRAMVTNNSIILLIV
jgi:hypothetical protein